MFRSSDPSPPRRVALLGHPVAHSRSPALQGAAFAALGLPVRYELWDTLPEELGVRVAALRQPEMLGANVTIPYKMDVGPFLDDLAPEVRRAGGAVNTITRLEDNGAARLVGHNTDLSALVRVLAEGVEGLKRAESSQTLSSDEGQTNSGRALLVLGAGGAARAALGAANALGFTPWIAARNLDAGVAARADVASSAEASAPGQERVLDLTDRNALASLLPRVDALVQTTSVGMKDPEASPLPLDLLSRMHPGALVVDLVYASRTTALVGAAHAIGLRAVDGLELLLYQGMEAFTLWTGEPPPVAEMREALARSRALA